MAARISRRRFLTLLGYGAIALVSAPFFNFYGLKQLKKISTNFVSAQSAGSWSIAGNTTLPAIHVALVGSGKVLYIAGSGFDNSLQKGPYSARLLDPNSGSEKNLVTSEDIFCHGFAHLSNGNVLIAGGTLLYDTNVDNCNGTMHGLNAAYEFDTTSETFVRVSSMAQGRWYPTCLTLPDGGIFVVSGLDEYGTNNALVEVYDPVSKSFNIKYNPNSSLKYCAGGSVQTACPGSGSPCYGGTNKGVASNLGLYPRAHLMPSGLVVICGFQTTIRSWDPATGIWSTLTQSSAYRSYGTSFLLPLQNTSTERGKILLVGGSPDSASLSTASVEILDFNAGSSTTPVVRQVSSIANARRMTNPVILPNGKVVIFGGCKQGVSQPVYIPEVFDPVNETWSALPAASVARVYHGVALLLSDGRVWTAGSAPFRTSHELRIEIFSPDYISAGSRPTIIGSPTVGAYGSTITIQTPDAADVASVSLVRLMSATHHFEPNQRLIWLQIVGRTSTSITVSAPLNGKLAPPGSYMIHILNSSSIPSVAKIITIPGTTTGDITPPSQVVGLSVTAVSKSQLNLLWNANTESDIHHYNVYRGTTSGFPVNVATDIPIAQPTISSYSNTGLSALTTYYYRVAAVDNAGNIGSLSTEASGTTFEGTPPLVAITSPAANSSFPAGTTIAVTGTASDEVGGSGVKVVTVKVDSAAYKNATPKATGDWSTWSTSVTITTTGTHSIVAKATDNAGNFRTRSITVNIT